jgi:PilZ domain
MDQNRRRYLRKVPDDIAFIQIERDEVGKVLNISEGGLSFKSVTPVPRNLPVYFWFSFNLKDRIEGMGEVTWTDLSRTIGGVRFTQLSQENRERIQNWVSRLRREEPPEEEVDVVEEVPELEEEALVPQLVAVGEPEPFRPSPPYGPAKSNGIDRVARFVSKARTNKPFASLGARIAEEPKPAPAAELAATALGAPALGIEAPGLGIQSPKLTTPETESPRLGIEPPNLLPERPMFSMETGAAPSIAPSLSSVDAKSSPFSFRGIESLIELVPLQRHLSAKKRQLLCGILLGIGISALVTLPALKFWNSRAHAETIRPALPDSSPPRNNAATQPPASDPASVAAAKPSYPVAGVFSDPNPVLPRKETSQSLASRTQLPASFWKEERKTAAMREAVPVKNQKLSTGAAASQKPAAAASSASTTTDKKAGMNPNQLWGQVQAGNSKAAVELAELYIKGDGVPQNCQQARVLLLVASEKRNTAAIKRLHDLDKGGACP